jgi:DnaJ like chaperone protein
MLGLWGPFTPPDVQSAYRESLAQYDPEKIGHLGEEFAAVAEKKRQDITQAYEYFQRKYGII